MKVLLEFKNKQVAIRCPISTKDKEEEKVAELHQIINEALGVLGVSPQVTIATDKGHKHAN